MIAARTAIDLIIEMRYKLRSIGLRVQPQSTLIGDNLSVIVNTTSPASKINKKYLSCQIMRVREAIAAGFVRFAYTRSEHNASDVLTKPLPPLVFHRLLHPYLFQHLEHHHSDKVCDKPQPFRHQLASSPTKSTNKDTTENTTTK